MKKINIEKDLVEYDGIWHKKGEDDNCDKFTMVDLRQILKQQKEEIIGRVEEEIKKGINKYGCSSWDNVLWHIKEDILKVIANI